MFIDLGEPMGRLLGSGTEGGWWPDRAMSGYAAGLHAEIERETRPPPETQTRSPNEALEEPLTDRELEVLPLLAEGLTNKEIANRLYVSINTVKTHLHHIRAKLDADNRTHAVALAREFGLI